MSVRRENTSHMRHLLAAFNSGRELTFNEAAEVAFLSVKEARRYVLYLHGKKAVHIDRWEKQARGPRLAVWVVGEGEDAVRPKPSSAERSHLYRLRRRVPKPDALLRAFMPLPKACDE